ncbi:TPA: IS982 family transposase, partial [Streptococcus mutans]
WRLKAERRTIEARFSVLCSEFDIERPLARSLKGLELWLEQTIFAYNLGFFY